MYHQYFGLSEAPFSIAPDPRYLFLSDKHREALAHLIYGVGDQGGFVVLTGEVGTGKTTICRCLLQQIPDNADIAFIINPRQSSNQLLQSIFNDLGIAYDKGMTSKDLIDKLNEYLLATHARGRNTIVIIDEAQNLSVDVLEQLRLLTNLETNEKKLLQLLLLGQPELNELLAKPELRQLSQRITARYHLAPLLKQEVTDYIQHRLSVAGCRLELFPAAAIKTIYQLSQGVPRLINLICDRTLLGVYATNSRQATPKIVTNAAREVFPVPVRKNWQPLWLAVAAAAVILLVSLLWRPSSQQAPEPAQAAELTPAPVAITAAAALSEVVSRLHQLWGIPVNHADERRCNSTPVHGDIFCISSLTSWEQLYQFNVPAALQLQAPDGSTMTSLLQSISDQQAHFASSQGPLSLSLEQLQRYTLIDSYLLTRILPNLQLPVEPGDRYEQLPWLTSFLALKAATGSPLQATANVDVDNLTEQKSSKLGLLYSHYLTFQATPDATVYVQSLVEQVKSRQQQLGLAPTAIIDYSLLAAVSQQQHIADPVLLALPLEEG